MDTYISALDFNIVVYFRHIQTKLLAAGLWSECIDIDVRRDEHTIIGLTDTCLPPS